MSVSCDKRPHVTGIGLLSGGLDGMLAVKLLQRQGITVIGLTFETPFFSAAAGRRAAAQLGIELIVEDITDVHMAMLRNPRYGYGGNMNPCIDCHGLMVRRALGHMRERNASFVFTGEVLGERPMSQGKQGLFLVEKLSGSTRLLLRPLSALLLDPTLPEEQGLIDRSRLLDISGRSRKRQLAYAAEWGLTSFPNPAGGCLLTDPGFSRRLKDLFTRGIFAIDEIRLLKYGRHFRLDERTKAIIGRNERENDALRRHARAQDMFVEVEEYPSPLCLVCGDLTDDNLRLAMGLCGSYSDAPKGETAAFLLTRNGVVEQRRAVVPAQRTGLPPAL